MKGIILAGGSGTRLHPAIYWLLNVALFVLQCGLAFSSCFAQTKPSSENEHPIIGVNETNLAWRPRAERESTLAAIRDSGFRVVRLTWRRPAENSFHLLELAARDGLGIVLDIPGVSEETKVDGATLRAGNGAIGPQYGLSQLDMHKFATELALIRQGIERFQPDIVALEFANEANWADFNGDLPLVTPGVVWNQVESMPPPHRDKFVAGMLRYDDAIKILRVWRDSIGQLRQTPILSGGVADVDDVFVTNIGGSAVTSDAFLTQLRIQGTLAKVNAVGLHTYMPVAAFQQNRTILGKNLMEKELAICDAESTNGKRCWITEFGANLPIADCASARDERERAIRSFLDEIRKYQNKIAALIYYNWSQTPQSALNRCNKPSTLTKVLTEPNWIKPPKNRISEPSKKATKTYQ